MPTGNPVFNMVPQTPPGLAGIPYMIGGMVAPMMGGIAHPYVGPNQSIADAYAASRINDPMYKQLLGQTYGQMGYQLGNTVGGMRFMDSIASMTGYDAGQMRRDLAGFGRGFGRSMVGSMVMPFADQMLNAAGVTGGSFLGSLNAIYSNRMSLMSPNMLLNPYDAMQQRSAMGATSAMMNLVNGIVSKTDASGNMMAQTNAAITQGFSRDRIAGLAMRMAGAGMFSGMNGGFAGQLQNAAGELDISKMDFSRGDFTTFGADSNVAAGSANAEKIQKFTRVFANKMKAGIEAMGAMRDMLKEVDGIEERLTALTGGEWLRSGSGATSARNAVQKLHAVTQMYNIDPHAALDQISSNAYTLQSAALGGSHNADVARSFGFDGGGMFRLEAQTEMLSGIEGMINAHGVRGDLILANRIRQQGVQAMARNMNTQAGVAAQVLAWARQKGALSDDQAKAFQAGLVSGDQSVMDDNVNRMLTTVFGSSKRGRELMQDSMFVQRMRQDMDGEAGRYAMQTIIRGADSEFLNRERVTAAERRLDFSKMALSAAGMKTTQTPEGVKNLVSSVSATLRGLPDGDAAATFFEEQYAARVAKGASPNAAFQATMASFKNSPATRRYADQMDLAVKRQSAVNNEFAFTEGGLESGQAKAMADFMRSSGSITSKQSGEIMKMIRGGDSRGALALAEQLGAGLSAAQRTLLSDVRKDARSRYESAMATIGDNRVAEQLVSAAGKAGFGSSEVGKSWDAATKAIQRYMESGKTDADRDIFEDELEKSNIYRVGGQAQYDQLREQVLGATDGELADIVKTRGRQSTVISQLASDQLKGYGYSYMMDGYFGGGRYSGNNERLLGEREKAIRNIVKTSEAANAKYAGDRNTFAQDLLDWAHGDKKFAEVLKIYDNDGTLDKLFKDTGVFAARDAWNASKDAFGEGAKEMDALVRDLRRSGRGKSADEIERLLGDAENISEVGLETSLLKLKHNGGNALTPEQIDKVKNVAALKRSMVAAGQAMDSTLADAAGNQDVVDAYGEVAARRDYDERTRPARHAAALAFIDNADIDALSGSASFRSAYAGAKKVVSDKELAARLNTTEARLKGRDQRELAQTRLAMLKEKYAAGDRGAINAMDAFKVAAEDNKVTKIKGEIILKSGGDQESGTLEGNFGGL